MPQFKTNYQEPVRIKPDLSQKELYKGNIPSIVGKVRLLILGSQRETFEYVDSKDVAAVKARYGEKNVRELGVVTEDVRPGK